MNKETKTMKHTINYRNTEKDKELYDWIENNAKDSVFRAQDIIKDMLYKLMIADNKK